MEKLSPVHQNLADYMELLSEQAYNASWMDNLEFDLWKIRSRHLNQYGRLVITDEIINTLKELSEKAGGWIIYNEGTDNLSFVPLNEWEEVVDHSKK